MTGPTDSSSPPSAIETLEARSRKLGSASDQAGPSGSRGKSSGDGCAKGALLGCGCLTVLVVIAMIVAAFTMNNWVKAHIISPDPVELPDYEWPEAADRAEAESNWDVLNASGARIDMSFSDAQLSYLLEVDSCPDARCIYIRFPEDDRFEMRSSVLVPALDGYLNGVFEGTLRVEGGRVETMTLDRAMLREAEMPPDMLTMFSDNMRQNLYTMIYEDGLRSIVIENGSIALDIDPDGSAVPDDEAEDETPEETPALENETDPEVMQDEAAAS